MVGVVNAQTVIEDKLQAMGYVNVKAAGDTLLLNKDQQARGHEFHYSRLVVRDDANLESCYLVDKNRANSQRKAGYQYKKLLASYIHLHFVSNPDIAKKFCQNVCEI